MSTLFGIAEALEPRALLAAGDPVTSFGAAGVMPLPVPSDFEAASILRLTTGKVLVLGGSATSGVDGVRLKGNLELDTAFGNRGTIDTFLDGISQADELPPWQSVHPYKLDDTRSPGPRPSNFHPGPSPIFTTSTTNFRGGPSPTRPWICQHPGVGNTR